MSVSKKGFILVGVLGIGILFSIVAILETNAQGIPARSPIITTIQITQGSASKYDGVDTFSPQITKVVIGKNNTVRWSNNDDVTTIIQADNDKVDPSFFQFTDIPTKALTKVGQELVAESTNVDLIKRPNILHKGDSFEYTFTVPGEYGYHGKPWQRGTIIVEPPLK